MTDRPQQDSANSMWGGRFAAGPDAIMEATGMVNDHVTTCHRHAALSRPQAAG